MFKLFTDDQAQQRFQPQVRITAEQGQMRAGSTATPWELQFVDPMGEPIAGILVPSAIKPGIYLCSGIPDLLNRHGAKFDPSYFNSDGRINILRR